MLVKRKLISLLQLLIAVKAIIGGEKLARRFQRSASKAVLQWMPAAVRRTPSSIAHNWRRSCRLRNCSA
jgi:hypothetical protein